MKNSREEAHHAGLLRYADTGHESQTTFQASNFPMEHADGSLSIWLLSKSGMGVGAQGEAGKAKAGAP